MLQLVPYINFPGNAREAMTYYQEVFGGELDISSFGDFQAEGMPADGVMHAQLESDGFTVMASDAMPGSEETWGGTRVYCCFFGDDVERGKGWYERLAADGTVGAPLEKQMWGDMYGDVKDKFGIEWMFNLSEAQA